MQPREQACVPGRLHAEHVLAQQSSRLQLGCAGQFQTAAKNEAQSAREHQYTGSAGGTLRCVMCIEQRGKIFA